MAGRVMVFAPAPILTVTVEQRGEAVDLHVHAGGQGVWQARMLAALRAHPVLCAAVGGETGQVLRTLLEAEPCQLKIVAGESSSGFYVHDRRSGQREVVAEEAGNVLSRHELDELYSTALVEGLNAEVCLLSGPADPATVPPEIYRRLAHDLTENKRRVIVDLTGDHLTAALEGGVDVLKISHEDLPDDDVAQQARRLRDAGARTVIVSRAERSAIAVSTDKAGNDVSYEIVVPKVLAADARGAGDSMIAGVAAALATGASLERALHIGAAAGTVNVTRHGLGTGTYDEIMRLSSQVELRLLSMQSTQDSVRLTPNDLAQRSKP